MLSACYVPGVVRNGMLQLQCIGYSEYLLCVRYLKLPLISTEPYKADLQIGKLRFKEIK